ncbi:MAG: hypothetical protein WCJ19_05640 [bacterium]
MDQLTQADIIDMYRSQVSNMEGGRRRRVGRPRKAPVRRRGRGLVGGVVDASDNVEGYISGMGLVGGRRRVGRPRGSTRPKMSAKVMEFFASRRKPRKRGRGLVGGKSNQDIYDELIDAGVEVKPEMVALMQAGIQPETPKERLIRQIRNLEKRIGVGQSSAEKLKKYTAAALKTILGIYQKNMKLLAYPPVFKQSDLFEEDRWETPGYYEGKVAEEALEPA